MIARDSKKAKDEEEGQKARLFPEIGLIHIAMQHNI
jgi:hypothetical protein